jgi:hypothetical protein
MTQEVRDALAAHRKYVILEYAEVAGNTKEVCSLKGRLDQAGWCRRSGTISGGRAVFLGRDSLVHAIGEYAGHCHAERSYQGIGNALVNGVTPQGEGIVEVRERLGELLKYYHRRVA